MKKDLSSNLGCAITNVNVSIGTFLKLNSPFSLVRVKSKRSESLIRIAMAIALGRGLVPVESNTVPEIFIFCENTETEEINNKRKTAVNFFIL
jgi:hypothetical protein